MQLHCSDRHDLFVNVSVTRTPPELCKNTTKVNLYLGVRRKNVSCSAVRRVWEFRHQTRTFDCVCNIFVQSQIRENAESVDRNIVIKSGTRLNVVATSA